MTSEILFIGCGDIGRRLAQQWLERGYRPVALARSGDSAARLQSLGIEVVHGDLDQPDSLHCLDEHLHGRVVYYLAPPPAQGDGDSRIAHFLAHLDASRCPAQVIYMGTSGVYGDVDGAWVDEHSPTQPQTARARRRLAAEDALREVATQRGFPLTLLRVGGIYGPGRLPEMRLRQGLPLLREEACGYSNRIHLADLLAICIAAAEQPGKGCRIFNVSDGHPGNMTQYFLAVADALGLPHPPQLSLAEAKKVLSPAMLSYLGESRRMNSSKVLRELDLALQYPDLESGLSEIDPI